MKKLLLLFLSLVLLIGCSGESTNYTTDYPPNTLPPKVESHYPNYVNIKYRSDEVNIAHPRFEVLDTSKSSWIRGAWYDDSNDYMIISFNGTYYHYCGLPKSTWVRFKRANSFGSDYNAYIKDNYDCRLGYVPSY